MLCCRVGDVVTTVVSATPVSAGCRVVTSSAYPDSRHTPALSLARRLVPTPYPLGTKAFGSGSGHPAFLVEGDVTTGKQHDVVSSKFVLLTAATATGPTTGRATAAPIPGNSFAKVRMRQAWCVGQQGNSLVGQHTGAECAAASRSRQQTPRCTCLNACAFCWSQYEFKLQPAGCKTCTPLTFLSNTVDGSFTGLTPNTTVSEWGRLAPLPRRSMLHEGQHCEDHARSAVTRVAAAAHAVQRHRHWHRARQQADARAQPAAAHHSGITHALAHRSQGNWPNHRQHHSYRSDPRLHEGVLSVGGQTPAASLTAPGILIPRARSQYVFTVRKAKCPVAPCPVLTFPSRSLTVPLTGLDPGTKVGCSLQRQVLGRDRSRRGRSRRGGAGVA